MRLQKSCSPDSILEEELERPWHSKAEDTEEKLFRPWREQRVLFWLEGGSGPVGWSDLWTNDEACFCRCCGG